MDYFKTFNFGEQELVNVSQQAVMGQNVFVNVAALDWLPSGTWMLMCTCSSYDVSHSLIIQVSTAKMMNNISVPSVLASANPTRKPRKLARSFPLTQYMFQETHETQTCTKQTARVWKLKGRLSFGLKPTKPMQSCANRTAGVWKTKGWL